jgi:hypothetical protein
MHYTPSAPGTLNFGSLYNHLITEQIIRFLSNGSRLNIETPNAIRNSIGMLMSGYLVLGLDFWGFNSFSSEMFLSRRLEFEKP